MPGRKEHCTSSARQESLEAVAVVVPFLLWLLLLLLVLTDVVLFNLVMATSLKFNVQ